MKLVAVYVTPGPKHHVVVTTVRSGDRLVTYAVDPISEKLLAAKYIDSLAELAGSVFEAGFGNAAAPVIEIPIPRPPHPTGIPQLVLQVTQVFWKQFTHLSKEVKELKDVVTHNVDVIR